MHLGSRWRQYQRTLAARTPRQFSPEFHYRLPWVFSHLLPRVWYRNGYLDPLNTRVGCDANMADMYLLAESHSDG